MPRKQKVYAYITRGEQLLVFNHVDFPEAGLQVPGGTLEPDELPESAVLREAAEETGLEGLQLAAYLGCDEVHLPDRDPGERHQRHFYHLLCTMDAPENWQHYENHPSEGPLVPILLDFYWLPLVEAKEALNPYYTFRLGELHGRLSGGSP
jgi:8-oxo-dGTP diphosphatase